MNIPIQVESEADPFDNWPPAPPSVPSAPLHEEWGPPITDMETIGSLLVEILAELKHMNATERAGAVSSAELKFLANGTPQPTIKAYTGSVVPVYEALEAYGRMVREAQARAMDGWRETVEHISGAS